MNNGRSMICLHRLSKWFSLKFPQCYLDQKTPEEGWSMQQPKCDNDNHNEDIGPTVNRINTLNSFACLVHYYYLFPHQLAC